jgi:drug/metabolite transporter (DMT)-like permease
MTVRVALAYAVICAIWGSTWLAIKVALTGMPPLVGVGVRFVIAGLFLYLVAALVRPPAGERTPFSLVVVLAATLFGGNYAFTYFAETHLASGLVAVLFGTMPFFIVLFGAVMFGERVTPFAVLGAVVALGGVAVISLTGQGGELIYVLAALIASALSAFANTYLKRYAHTEPLRTLPPAMLLSGVVTLAFGLIFTPVDIRAALGTAPLAATLYLALLGSGVAFFLNHWLLQRLTTWTVGLVTLIIPVIAVAIGVAVAHEPFGPRDVIGAILVIIGVAMALTQRENGTGVPAIIAADHS